MLEIHIPFANGGVSDLLKADAGDCPNLRGESSDNHEYSYNVDDQKSILKISIDGCNLDKDLHYSPQLRTSDGQYHMAIANVTIGVTDEDSERDLIFYNAVLGAECGTKTDYTVTFDYSQKIDKHEETGCHANSPEGQCIVPAFEEYEFTFKEYDETFEHENTDTSNHHKANDMIYLQIESESLPDDKTFSVKSCKFVDKIVNPFDESTTFENYTMFDATNDCKNKHIDLNVGFREGAIQISHRLFLLTKGDQDSYSLECDIKVCDSADTDSDCQQWQDTCEGNDSDDNDEAAPYPFSFNNNCIVNEEKTCLSQQTALSHDGYGYVLAYNKDKDVFDTFFYLNFAYDVDTAPLSGDKQKAIADQFCQYFYGVNSQYYRVTWGAVTQNIYKNTCPFKQTPEFEACAAGEYNAETNNILLAKSCPRDPYSMFYDNGGIWNSDCFEYDRSGYSEDAYQLLGCNSLCDHLC